MNRLINYIKKLGITEDSYKVENFGKDYFYNTKLSAQGVCVVFDYKTYSPMLLEQQAKMLKKYCARYGYKVFNESGAPGLWWFSIMRYSQYEALQDYNSFADASLEECNKLFHEYYIAGTHKEHMQEINDAMKSIMLEYECYYLDYLKHKEEEAV